MPDEKDLLNPDDFQELDDSTDGKEEEVSEEKEDSENAKTQESNEDEKNQKRDLKKDAFFAEKRREKERKEREAREQKIKEDAKIEGKLEVLKVNPYTDEKIIDDEDLKIYEIQKKLEEEGLDPVNDLPKRLAEINRKQKESAKAEEEKQKEFAKYDEMDRNQLQKAYPELSLEKLDADNDFQEFAKGKIHRWTLTEIYEAYQSKKQKDSANKEKAMVDKVADDVAKNMTKVPSSNQGGNPSIDSLDNIKTKEQFQEYWRKKYNS